MKTAKQAALDLIEKLPEDVSTATIIEELLLVQTINERIAEVDRGEVISHEEAKKRMAKWLKSRGR